MQRNINHNIGVPSRRSQRSLLPHVRVISVKQAKISLLMSRRIASRTLFHSCHFHEATRQPTLSTPTAWRGGGGASFHVTSRLHSPLWSCVPLAVLLCSPPFPSSTCPSVAQVTREEQELHLAKQPHQKYWQWGPHLKFISTLGTPQAYKNTIYRKLSLF